MLAIILRTRQVKDRAFDGGQFLFKHPHPDTKMDPRECPSIAWLMKEGLALQRMADRFGVTRQRIHQILKEE